MKSGFKDPIAVKEGKKIKSPWNFDAPSYDERTSCFVNAGTNYGVGHKQPVGRQGNPKSEVDVLPKGRVKTMETDYIHKGRVSNVEIDEKD
jgi:hypothetical protein